LLQLIEKKGLVKEDVFFEILGLHKINLSNEAKTMIKKTYCQKNMVKYMEVMPVIQIDLETAADNEENWVINKGNRNADSKSSRMSEVRSQAGYSDVLSQKSLAAFKAKNDLASRVGGDKDQDMMSNYSSMEKKLKDLDGDKLNTLLDNVEKIEEEEYQD
jgi:hypothetical protein